METFELVSLKNGVTSLRSLQLGETFHPGIGPMDEATLLHVKQQQLAERCRQTPDFILWDVGLGAGANAIAAIRELQTSDLRHPVEIHSFDKSIAPLHFAYQNAEALKYPVDYLNEITELLNQGYVKIGPHIHWYFHFGDFTETISDLNIPSPHAIFYDPYSLKGNTEMWTLDHFTKLYQKLNPERVCLWSNYTCSTSVRVTLLLAGFSVGTGCGIHKKLQTTIASNHLDALERPLTRDWLDRVCLSHTSAPLREKCFEVAPIIPADFAVLSQLPQFKN